MNVGYDHWMFDASLYWGMLPLEDFVKEPTSVTMSHEFRDQQSQYWWNRWRIES